MRLRVPVIENADAAMIVLAPSTTRACRRAAAAAAVALLASLLAPTPAAANDSCDGPAVIGALPFDDTRDTTDATTAASDPTPSCGSQLHPQNSNSVWYRFTPASSGLITAFTTGSDYDTLLAVYTGSCGALEEVACSDDAGGTIAGQVTLAVTAGTTYLFEVAGFGDSGGGDLQFRVRSVRPADNDECSAPTPITHVPFADTVDARDATTAPDDPLQSCSFGSPARNARSLWYAFTPPSNGIVKAQTFASSYDTVLTAYTGTCGNLREIACSDDRGDGLQSMVVFRVTGGTPYLFEATEYEPEDAATLQFGLEFAPPLAKCQKAIQKAALAFATKKLQGLGKCANKILACIQAKPDDKRDACVTKAGDKCVNALAKIAKAEDKLEAKILKACSDPPVTLSNLLEETGLGYAAAAADCEGRFGITLDGAAAVAACVARQHECNVERLLELEEPRAKELMDIAGVPAETLATLTCLARHEGTGADVDDEKGVGKAIAKCETTIKKAAAKFVKAKLKGSGKCLERMFTCVQQKLGDERCLTKARGTCDKEFGKLDRAAEKLDATVDKKCLEDDVAYASLAAPEGANLAALAAECARYVESFTGIEDYKRCLFRQHTCRSEELLEFAAPRAATLFSIAGHTLFSEFCPAP